MEMSGESVRRVWLRSAEIHLRAARAHEVAAERFSRLGDPPSVAQSVSERERADAERRAFAALVAKHPECEQDAGELWEEGPAPARSEGRTLQSGS